MGIGGLTGWERDAAVADTGAALASTAGEAKPSATFYWDSEDGHAYIQIRTSTTTVTTDAWPEDTPSPFVPGEWENLNTPRKVALPSKQLFSIDFDLPNPEAAIEYIDKMVNAPAHELYPYSKRSNSCITWCADVLRAGGLSQFEAGEIGTALLKGMIPPEVYDPRNNGPQR